MITVDRETWNRWNETGEGVLFRAGVDVLLKYDDGTSESLLGAQMPAEFVEWAKSCETCGGDGQYWGRVPNDGYAVSHYLGNCRHCHNGKRRIAVTVPCDFCNGNTPPKNVVAPPCWKCSGQKLLTVGHVVVEWGPLLVVGDDGNCDDAVPHLVVCDGPSVGQDFPAAWICGGDNLDEYLPPGVDPATLVGQWALGVKVVES